ncbi:MAG: 16S rRNA (cytosine(1402)-N(4))-methyltransferase RsmH [Planctomycetales bacterium]
MRSRGSSSGAKHIPVLRREVLQALELQPGMSVVDGTVGAGGHSRDILERIGPTGLLIGIDRDPMMLEFARQKLVGDNVHLVQNSYAELESILAQLGIAQVDRILLDLGLSSDQLADPQRGFGFDAPGSLDMRFDTSQGQPAWELLSKASEEELAAIFQEYGEERFARRIAQTIVQQRANKPIKTAADLVAVVHAALPANVVSHADKEPATRVFQALRIVVNRELEQLEKALDGVLYRCLNPGGRAVIISFHSLEDFRVKQSFRNSEQWQIQTPKPVTATPAEARANPRSRTAKLRGAQKKP